MLGLAVQGHGLGFLLPALLQGFDGVDAQLRCGAQRLGFLDQGVAALGAFFLSGLQSASSSMDGRFPLGLQLGIRLLAQVSRIAPALRELVDLARLGTPVIAFGMGQSPGLDLFNELQALRFLCGSFLLELIQPGLHGLVGLGAGSVEFFPERVVGQAALVGLLPGLAQLTQGLLHFSTPHGRLLVGSQQGLCLAQQLLTQLIGTPALPAFELTGCGQGLVDSGIQCRIKMASVRLEHIAQGRCCTCTGFAMAFGHFLLKCFKLLEYGLCRLLTQGLAFSGIHLGLGTAGRRNRLGRCFTTQSPDFVRPHRHAGQRRIGLGQSRVGLLQRCVETLPHRLQLVARGLQLGSKFQVYAGPCAVLHQLPGLHSPGLHIGLQGFTAGARFLQWLGGKHLHPLGQQHSRFPLDHHLVLQILDPAHHIGQATLESGQRFTGQGCTGLGRIALPGQSVSNVEPMASEQLLGLGSPLLDQGILLAGTLELIQTLLEHLGGPFVTGSHLAVNLLQGFERRFGGQPVTQAVRPVARSGCSKCPTGQLVQGRNIGRRMAGSHCVTPCRPGQNGQPIANQSPIVPRNAHLLGDRGGAGASAPRRGPIFLTPGYIRSIL